MNDAAPVTNSVRTDHSKRRRSQRRSRGWRIARNALIGVVAVIAAIWLILFITKGRFLKGPFQSIAGGLTHRTVTVRGDFQLYFAPWRIKFLAEGMTISNPAWATRPNLFQAEKIDSRIAPLSLIFGKRHFHRLDLTNGAVDLEWNAAHDHNSWTFSEAKGGKPFELPYIDRATVVGTRCAISIRRCNCSPISRSTRSDRPTPGSAMRSG